jgi:hypothetical protein
MVDKPLKRNDDEKTNKWENKLGIFIIISIRQIKMQKINCCLKV